MSIVLHRANERGGADHGWLTTRHSFSFAQWYEPTQMGYGALRVLNDDTIAPNTGFGAHSHRDMEIITIVTEGEVTHGDSMGNSGVVGAGEVQVMSAGTGVVHSEKNASPDQVLSLFQLWIAPRSHGIEPRYAQRAFGFDTQAGGCALLVSPDAREGSLSIHQDAYISLAILEKQSPLQYSFYDQSHGVYLFVVEGSVVVTDQTLNTRDGLGVSDVSKVSIESIGRTRVLIIEVPLQ